MQEVTCRIRFTQPCLGSVRKQQSGGVIYAMIRNHDGVVLLMPTWWSAITRYAAKVLNAHQDAVNQIDWDPCIDGTSRRWKRFLAAERRGGRRPFALHEAFKPGDVIGVNCVLPQKLTISDFWRVLAIAGQYRGISPHNPRDYGNFEVVEVRPRRRKLESAPEIKKPEQATHT